VLSVMVLDICACAHVVTNLLWRQSGKNTVRAAVLRSREMKKRKT